MTIQELLTKPNTILLDVRMADEVAKQSIPNAMNISLQEIMQGNFPSDKEANYIIFCARGNRSLKAIRILQIEGFDKLYNGGGINDLLKLMR